MKKTIKTIVSIIAVICLIATQFVVFAEDSNESTEMQLAFTSTNIHVIKSSGYVSKSYTQTVTKNELGMYILPLPTLERGQKIGSYKITYLTEAYGASSTHCIKFPYEDGYTSGSGMSTSTEAVAARISAPGNYIAEDSKTEKLLDQVVTTGRNTYLNTLDLTSYANECYNNNVRGSFIIMLRPVSSSFYFLPLTTAAGETPAATCTIVDADPLAIIETTPENGADSIASSTSVSFTYNNPINIASATVNGVATGCTINGSTVTLNTTFEQYTEYSAVVNAEDVNGSTLETGLSFTTSCNTIVTNEKSGASSYVVSASGATPTGKGTTQLKFSDNNHFVLCKIPISDLKGKAVDYYKFTFVGNIPNSIQTVKFPGEEWDLETMTVNDVNVKNIINNSSNYIAYDSYRVVNLAKYVEQWTLDISSYARECVAANQDYMYLGFTAHGTTCAVYAYSSSYEPTWSYGINSPEFKTVEDVKIVSSDNANGYEADGLTALAKGSSYKAITSITNKTAENMTVVIAIADYDGNTLESVSFKTVEVKSGALNQLVESDAIVAASTSNKAKAFVWNSIGNEPLVKNLEVSVR